MEEIKTKKKKKNRPGKIYLIFEPKSRYYCQQLHIHVNYDFICVIERLFNGIIENGFSVTYMHTQDLIFLKLYHIIYLLILVQYIIYY